MSEMFVSIVSAEKELFSGEVSFFAGMSRGGELGIYPGHLPLLTELMSGQVRLTLKDGKEEVFWVSGGILEIQPTHIIVLANSAERAADLDEAAVLAAKAKVEDQLSQQKGEFDYALAQKELQEVIAQISAIERHRKIKR